MKHLDSMLDTVKNKVVDSKICKLLGCVLDPNTKKDPHKAMKNLVNSMKGVANPDPQERQEHAGRGFLQKIAGEMVWRESGEVGGAWLKETIFLVGSCIGARVTREEAGGIVVSETTHHNLNNICWDMEKKYELGYEGAVCGIIIVHRTGHVFHRNTLVRMSHIQYVVCRALFVLVFDQHRNYAEQQPAPVAQYSRINPPLIDITSPKGSTGAVRRRWRRSSRIVTRQNARQPNTCVMSSCISILRPMLSQPRSCNRGPPTTAAKTMSRRPPLRYRSTKGPTSPNPPWEEGARRRCLWIRSREDVHKRKMLAISHPPVLPMIPATPMISSTPPPSALPSTPPPAH